MTATQVLALLLAVSLSVHCGTATAILNVRSGMKIPEAIAAGFAMIAIVMGIWVGAVSAYR